MAASAYKADNLLAIVDQNGLQAMGKVTERLDTNPLPDKWKSFGWNVLETNGHDMEAFKDTILSENNSGRPRLVIANTIKGKGVSIMENNPNWHFKLPGRKELKVFKEELGITDEELV